MKKWQKILMVIFGVIIVLSMLKDVIIKTVITSVGSDVVGASMKVGSFGLGILTHKVQIRDFKLYNPKGFPRETMVDLPEVKVDYDLGALLSGHMHFPLVVVNLKELVVIRNPDGKLNVDSLKVVEEQKKKGISFKQEQIALKIDVMKLNVDRVVFKDLSKGPEPLIQVFDVGLKDKTFKDISSVQQMVTLILVQAMGHTAIRSAQIYAAATVLGVGFLPAGIVGILTGQDHSSVEYNKSFDRVYQTTVSLLQNIGLIKNEDKAMGTIKATVQGCDLNVKIETTYEHKTKVTVSARQLMIPKEEVAAGILYQITDKLK